jgi:hypothetical protein
VEQNALAQQVDLLASAYSQPALVSQRIPTFLCPSDPNDKLSGGNPPTYPATYGFGWGDWYTGNGDTGQGNNGAFPFVPYPCQLGVRLLEITDGLANTAGAAEVKALGGYMLRSGGFGAKYPPPAAPGDVDALSGQYLPAGAHAGWAVGFLPSTGLTFLFPPNTYVPHTTGSSGQTVDIDWAVGGTYEYGVITARSYHVTGVNVLLMDGSVRFVGNSIERATWRALGTRNGGEPVAVPD